MPRNNNIKTQLTNSEGISSDLLLKLRIPLKQDYDIKVSFTAASSL